MIQNPWSRASFVLVVCLAFLLLGSMVCLAGDADLPPVSALFVAIFALPAYVVLLLRAPPRRALGIILLFSALPLIIELFAVSTGIPYGDFNYSHKMGPMAMGIVPWTAVFVLAPLVIGTFVVAGGLTRTRLETVLLSTSLLVAVDLVLDPCAVDLGLWQWGAPGAYYGIPLTNYLGWIIVGLAASTLMSVLTRGLNLNELRWTGIGLLTAVSF